VGVVGGEGVDLGVELVDFGVYGFEEVGDVVVLDFDLEDGGKLLFEFCIMHR